MCLMSYVNNKGADQPAHLRSLISAFVVRCLDSIISLDSIGEISRVELASVAAQAGLCLAWSEIPEDTFSHDKAEIQCCYRRRHVSLPRILGLSLLMLDVITLRNTQSYMIKTILEQSNLIELLFYLFSVLNEVSQVINSIIHNDRVSFKGR